MGWQRVSFIVALLIGSTFLIGQSSAVGAADPAQPGSVSPFTWSGSDAAAGVNSNWSDPNNWVGGIAPAPGSTVDLVFPFASTQPGSQLTATNNDIANLVVDDMAWVLQERRARPE